MLARNQLGVLYGVASVACFAMMDACVKWLDQFPVGEVLFARFFFGLIPILMLVPKNEFKTFYKTTRPKLHAFRAVTGTLAIIALFIALREIPLADVVSLTFGGPIFVTLGSIFFLSEKVGIRRWSAVLIGFIGMLMIVKPAYDELNIYYLFPIIFCIFFACVALSIRSLSSTEPNYRIALYFSLLSMIVGLATLPFGWIMPSKFELFLLIFTGIIGSVANILLTVSLRIAEASLVTPTKYLNLVFAILLGYFIWGEIPKVLTLLGAGLIIVSSVIIFMRESQLNLKTSCKSETVSKYPSYWLKAIKTLSKRDKVLKKLIIKYNDKFLTTRKDIFYSLCKSIVGQQISVSAANSVFKKFQKKTKRINPLKVSKLSISQLKSCGLSRQKALGIKELSIKFVKKEFDPKLIKNMNDEEAIQYLSSLRQIGRWSAEMILLFTYNRSNIWPLQDIGLKSNIK